MAPWNGPNKWRMPGRGSQQFHRPTTVYVAPLAETVIDAPGVAGSTRYRTAAGDLSGSQAYTPKMLLPSRIATAQLHVASPSKHASERTCTYNIITASIDNHFASTEIGFCVLLDTKFKIFQKRFPQPVSWLVLGKVKRRQHKYSMFLLAFCITVCFIVLLCCHVRRNKDTHKEHKNTTSQIITKTTKVRFGHLL